MAHANNAGLSPVVATLEAKPEICQDGCLYNNEDKRNMLQCHSCMIRFHHDCVGEISTSKSIWSCCQCRDSNRLLRMLSKEVSAIKGLVFPLPAMLSDLKDLINKQSAELKSLSVINAELSKQLADKDSLYKTKCDQFDQLNAEHLKLLAVKQPSARPTLPTKPRTLLIGSSMIRNVSSHNKSVEIQTLPGATLDDLSNRVSSLDSNYDHILIVAGGNDCSKSTSTSADISNSMQSLIANAKVKASNVTISSILPRPKEPQNQLKVDHTNEAIKKLCDKSPAVEFKDNDGTFTLRDLTPNPSHFISDGVHLSDAGTTSLIKNLGLSEVCSVRHQKRHLGPNSSRFHPSRSNSDDIHRRQIRCWNCNETGHTNRTCHHQPVRIVCYSCGLPGHKSNRCTK